MKVSRYLAKPTLSPYKPASQLALFGKRYSPLRRWEQSLRAFPPHQ